MSAKTIFWVGVALYEIAVLAKFCILPALRRRERTAREKAALAKYWKFCH